MSKHSHITNQGLSAVFNWLKISSKESISDVEIKGECPQIMTEIYIHEYDHGTLAESILAVFKLNKPHYCVCIYNHEFGVFFHPFGLTGAYMCEARQNRFDGFLSLRKRHYIGKTDLPFEDICKIAKTIQEGFGGQYRDSLRFCRAFLVRISMHWTEQDEFSKICKSAMIPLDLDFMETASMILPCLRYMFAKHQGDVESILYELNVVDPLVIRRLHRDLKKISKGKQDVSLTSKLNLAEARLPSYVRPSSQLVSMGELIEMYYLVTNDAIWDFAYKQTNIDFVSKDSLDSEKSTAFNSRLGSPRSKKGLYPGRCIMKCCIPIVKTIKGKRKFNIATFKSGRRRRHYLHNHSQSSSKR
ncbi:hypothetical protein ACOME3_001354 [Neoechinorhynchus agilis]